MSGKVVVYSPGTAGKIAALLALFPDRTVEALRGAQMQYARILGNDGALRIQKILSAPIADSATPDAGDLGGGAGASASVYTQALTVAGVIPTGAEIDTALAASGAALDHDLVILTVSSVPKFAYTIRVGAVATESGIFVRQFGSTFTAIGWQLGIY